MLRPPSPAPWIVQKEKMLTCLVTILPSVEMNIYIGIGKIPIRVHSMSFMAYEAQ